MRNQHLESRAEADIDRQVAKVLKDLGSPEPPLRLEYVRELLELDRAYYCSSDAGILSETIHRLKVSGQQVIKRPAIMLEIVKRMDLKALWVPDRKRILLDSELPLPKQRWSEAHEIGHSLIPWHEAVMHGDQTRTLSFDCQQQVEAEANFAAGRLLFLRDIFTESIRDSQLTIDEIKAHGKIFGNTITSTLWRAVESCDTPAIGLVSDHPRQPPSDEPLRYFIRSRSFATQFPGITASQIFQTLKKFCRGGRGPIGHSEVMFRDARGDEHVFVLETFFNSYHALTLGTYHRGRPISVTF